MPVISEETFLAMQDDEPLQHYGVLGMKWGVRRNPDRAYSKAGKKLSRLDRKASKAEAKSAKWQSKAARSQAKASSAWFFKERRYNKASKQGKRAYKWASRANANTRRAFEWNRQMKEVFKNTKVSSINKETQRLGKKYSSMTAADLNSASVNAKALLDASIYFHEKKLAASMKRR